MNPLSEDGRGRFVIVGATLVSEQVTSTWVGKEFDPRVGASQRSRGRPVFFHPRVVRHRMDLRRNPVGPGSVELLGRETTVEEQRAPSSGPRLGQELGGHHSERESRVDQSGWQSIGGRSSSFEDRVESDRFGVRHARGHVREGGALVEVGRVNHVTCGSKFVGEGQESGGLALRVVEQKDLGHVTNFTAGVSGPPL